MWLHCPQCQVYLQFLSRHFTFKTTLIHIILVAQGKFTFLSIYKINDRFNSRMFLQVPPKLTECHKAFNKVISVVNMCPNISWMQWWHQIQNSQAISSKRKTINFIISCTSWLEGLLPPKCAAERLHSFVHCWWKGHQGIHVLLRREEMSRSTHISHMTARCMRTNPILGGLCDFMMGIHLWATGLGCPVGSVGFQWITVPALFCLFHLSTRSSNAGGKKKKCLVHLNWPWWLEKGSNVD